MSEVLWIRLTAQTADGQLLQWARLNDAGQVIDRGRAPASELPQGLPCRAVVAAEKTHWTRLSVPGRRKLEGATLAYALEDRLADAPESVHAVMGGVDRDGFAQVAVIERAWLEQALAGLKQAGIRLVSVIPEQMLFPGADDEWHMVWGEHVWLRMTDGSCLGMPGDVQQTRDWLRLAIERSTPVTHLVLHLELGHAAPDMAGLVQGLPITVTAGPDFDWAVAAQQSRRSDVELLSGVFARRGKAGIDRRLWRPAAWMAGILLVVNLAGYMIVAGGKIWEKHHIVSANQSRLMAAFPDTKVVVEPLAQMRRKVAELEHRTGAAAPSDFLPLLGRAGELLPASARSGVGGIRYGPSGLVLLLPQGVAGSIDWKAAGLHATIRPAASGNLDELTLEVGS